jgi:hypothetical protein
MADYPWTLKPSSLEGFLKNMPDRPEPEAVTQTYLNSLGYTSSSDRQIIPILKFINFIDSSGKPTDLFKNYRDTGKSKGIMAQALRDSYAPLFKTHAKPWEKSDADLENFFRTATGRGSRMLAATVGIFKTLCQFADFGAAAITIGPTPTPMPTPSPISAPTVQLPLAKEGGVTVNVNIRLELPATQDADVYDKIFESLKKHILSTSSKTD